MEAESENRAATNEETRQPEGGIDKKGLAARLMEIARESSAIMNDGRNSKELMDELYDDETGLPI